MEKAMMNTDMINDNDNIYLSIDNGLEFYKYPIVGDLVLSLKSAIDEYHKIRYSYPASVFIPFIAFYNFEKVADTYHALYFRDYLQLLGTTSISFHEMIPDCIKDKVKPTK